MLQEKRRELTAWQEEVQGRLTEVISLRQCPTRNISRRFSMDLFPVVDSWLGQTADPGQRPELKILRVHRRIRKPADPMTGARTEYAQASACTERLDADGKTVCGSFEVLLRRVKPARDRWSEWTYFARSPAKDLLCKNVK